MLASGTHQVDQVQGEDVDTASHSGQSADDGGEDAEATCTEQKVLWRKIHQGIINMTTVSWANESQLKDDVIDVHVYCQKPPKHPSPYTNLYSTVKSITSVSETMFYLFCLFYFKKKKDYAKNTVMEVSPL